MFPWTPTQQRGHVAIVVIRHGQTAWNAEGRFLGLTDLPLNDAGREQAQTLSPWRGQFTSVHSSPLLRAVQTAQVLEPSPSVWPDLAELDQGELEGMIVADAVAAHPDFFTSWSRDPGGTRVPGGGLLRELRDGALDAFDAVGRQATPGSVVAVVSHQLVLATTLATLSGESLNQWREHALPNVGAAVLSWSADGLRVELPRISPGSGRPAEPV